MQKNVTVETTYTNEAYPDMKAIVTERDGKVSDIMIYVNEGQHFLIDSGDIEKLDACQIIHVLAQFLNSVYKNEGEAWATY